jgi:hypothetical protein
MIKSTLISIIVATGLISCGQTSKSKPKIVDIETSNSVKNVQNDNEPFGKYVYTDSNGKQVIIENAVQKGGYTYTDTNCEDCTCAVLFTRISNETDNPLELKINCPADSFELPSIPGQYIKIFIPQDTMTPEREPLLKYGLTDLKSFLDNNRYKSSLLNRTIAPKESSGFYFVMLTIKSNIQGKIIGPRRAGLILKGENLFYRIINMNNKSNTILSDIEIRCGSINLEKLTLKK